MRSTPGRTSLVTRHGANRHVCTFMMVALHRVQFDFPLPAHYASAGCSSYNRRDFIDRAVCDLRTTAAREIPYQD